jgi:hypothetical protein
MQAKIPENSIASNQAPPRRIDLILMPHDPELEVRRILVERMAPDSLVVMLADPEWLVRYPAAERAPREAAVQLCGDPDAGVRAVVRQRLAGQE